MNITGTIAEYNPFHKGHQFHLEASRKETNADFTIIIMSGDFLQRGEAACLDKFSRTKMALLEGADLVLELPVAFATASAPDFARGGIEILNATGVATHLSFGSEWGNLEELNWLADFLTKEPEEFKGILSEKLKTGLSYPKARTKAFSEYLDNYSDFPCEKIDRLCEILNNPNNILSVAYLRSLKETNSTQKPVTIKRCGAGYHDISMNKGFASATAIRNLIKEKDLFGNIELLQEQLPKYSFTILKEHFENFPMVDNNCFSSQLYYKLITSAPKSLTSYAGVSTQLAERIQKELSGYRNFTDFTMALKRKNDSYTAISRALLHILLNIEPEDSDKIPYLRILGFRKSAGELLHKIKENATLPIITKPADAKYILDEGALALFEKELLCEQIYHSAYQNNPNYIPYAPYKNTPVII